MVMSENPRPSKSGQELGLRPRLYSASAFMLAGSVPVACYFMLMSMLMGRMYRGIAQMSLEELWMFGVTPIATATFFGFVSGAKIMDPLSVATGLQAVKRGLGVAFSSYAVFVLLIFGVTLGAHIAVGDDTLGTNVLAPFAVFFVGLIFVGIPIALAGGLGGWLLFRYSRQPNISARIADSPRLSSKETRIMRATVITALILSCSPAFFSMRHSNQAKLQERMDLDLIVAASDGIPARAQELLNAGADVEARDNANGTPILWAARGGHTEIVKMLLEHGANPNVVEHGNGNVTPLIWAASLDNIECVQMLLDHGADVNASTTQGNTALMKAAQNGTAGMVKLLLDHGADPSRSSYPGGTALEIAKANRSVASRVDTTTGPDFKNVAGKAEKRHDEIIQILQAREGKE